MHCPSSPSLCPWSRHHATRCVLLLLLAPACVGRTAEGDGSSGSGGVSSSSEGGATTSTSSAGGSNTAVGICSTCDDDTDCAEGTTCTPANVAMMGVVEPGTCG